MDDEHTARLIREAKNLNSYGTITAGLLRSAMLTLVAIRRDAGPSSALGDQATTTLERMAGGLVPGQIVTADMVRAVTSFLVAWRRDQLDGQP